MVPFFILLILVFTLGGLLWDLRVEYYIRFSRDGIHLRLRVYIFYQWIPLKIERRFFIDRLHPLRETLQADPFLRPLTKKRDEKKPKRGKIPMGAFKIEELYVRGGLGGQDDAFHCVLGVGALQILFKNMLCFLKVRCGGVEIRPFFDRDVFWLNLEGIACIHSAQIMVDAAKNASKGLKRRRAA